MKRFVSLGAWFGRHPVQVVCVWLAVAAAIWAFAPDLTRLSAESQVSMLGPDAESRRTAELVALAWPDRVYTSLAVAALHRPGGLSAEDHAFARRLATRFEAPGRPSDVLRVLGPNSAPEVAARLISRDRTVSLIAVPLASEFVRPATQAAVAWLQSRPGSNGLVPPPGLEIQWTGDAVFGRDYMNDVQTSLDRAAAATVALLLLVLLAVYRSVWLALIPLSTISICLVISRGLLAWLFLAGWEVSPLVQLFLVAVLFGSGTDFCLFVSWRFAEHWDPEDPAAAMRSTLRRGALALLTSAGTVMVGLLLMGTTRFTLFSVTGPSVALGLAVSLIATLTLTPALLVLLARWRPASFAGLTARSSGIWEHVGRVAMSRPGLSWALTLLLMVPVALVGLRTTIVQDLLSELPASTPSAQAYRLIASKFDTSVIAPLTIVLESQTNLRSSEGLALIDDLSRYLTRQRGVTEVRSATQPLGSTAPLDPARIGSRLAALDAGFGTIAEGAATLHKGLAEGAAKLRAALWIQEKTGLSLAPGFGPAPSHGTPRTESTKHADPRLGQVNELLRASDGAARIAEGVQRAHHEVGLILHDPVSRRALDTLLVNAETVRDHPELTRSLNAYIAANGRRAFLELGQSDRVFSSAAVDVVVGLQRRVTEFLDGYPEAKVRPGFTGANAESADIRALVRHDQRQSWLVIPCGVFVILLLALRDPAACLNLVGTMLLTYAFALGATHLLFVSLLGSEGLDWKVPYFLFVLLVAVGVDYNVFLMTRLGEEVGTHGLRPGIVRAIGQTGGLISSAAAITACSFASFLSSPLVSLRQLGFALVVGIGVDALLVRPLLVPCGHWLLARGRREPMRSSTPMNGQADDLFSSATQPATVLAE